MASARLEPFTTLYLATSNAGKLREFAPLVRPLLELLESPNAELRARAARDVVEDGQTFAENAAIKAEALQEELLSEGQLRFLIISDDSGLCVDALDGRPGLYSARYAGEKASASEHMAKLLTELGSRPDRSARFVCHLCLILHDGDRVARFDAEGRCEGAILGQPSGRGGFGYDPLFALTDGRSMAEISEEEKNRISHRGRAFQALLAQFAR